MPQSPQLPTTEPLSESQTNPLAIGPVWQMEDGKWVLPARTLGWEILGWTAKYIRQPDGPKAEEPWRYTPEQARLVLWWYAIDAGGRFPYRYGVLRRPQA